MARRPKLSVAAIVRRGALTYGSAMKTTRSGWWLGLVTGAASAACGGGAAPATDAAIVDAAPSVDAPAPTCTDGVRNGDEDGIDCGGGCPSCEQVEVADYYVAPDGDDAGPGTEAEPFATWEKLGEVLGPGQLAYIRGGTYHTTKGGDAYAHVHYQGLAGTPEAPIRIWAYPNERPVLDLSDVDATVSGNGLVLDGADHVWLRGLRITGLAQPTSGETPAGLGVVNDADGNTIERCEVDHVGGYGFYVGASSDDNAFVNCDAHHLADPYNPGYPWGGANGFMQTGNTGATGTLFSGCRAWWISDDGFDLYGEDGEVTIENSWSFWNGYQPDTFEPAGDGMGFKLGPTSSDLSGELRRWVHGNVAAGNRAFGFDQNGAQVRTEFHHNTTYANTKGWFWGYFDSIAHEFRNNLSIDDDEAIYGVRDAWTDDHNSWNGGVDATAADLADVDLALLAGPRGPGGALPDVATLRLAPGSDLIDAGADLGEPFAGAAPDLGAFERP